jgi:hypothetical protein
MVRKKLTKRRRVEDPPRMNEPLQPPSCTAVKEAWEPADGARVRFGGVEAREFVRYPGGGSAVPEDEPDPQWPMGMQDATPVYEGGNLVGSLRLPPLPMNHHREHATRSALRVRLAGTAAPGMLPPAGTPAVRSHSLLAVGRSLSVHDAGPDSDRPLSPQAGVMSDLPHAHPHAMAHGPHALAAAAVDLIAASTVSSPAQHAGHARRHADPDGDAPMSEAHGGSGSAATARVQVHRGSSSPLAAVATLEAHATRSHSHAAGVGSDGQAVSHAPPESTPPASPSEEGGGGGLRPILSVALERGSSDSTIGQSPASARGPRASQLRSPRLAAAAAASAASSSLATPGRFTGDRLPGVVSLGTVDQHQRWKELYNARRRVLRIQVWV